MNRHDLGRVRAICRALALPVFASITCSTVQQSMAQEQEPIEEIVVYGEQSLISLRKQVYLAEENFFDLFNALNEDDEFDVQCFDFAPTGTRIRRHACRAKFVVDAEAAEFSRWSDGPRVAVLPASAVIAQKRKEMGEKMLALLAERPELLEALDKVTTAKNNYAAGRRSRCEGKVISCGN